MSTSDYSLGQAELWFAVGAHDATTKYMYRNFGNIVAAEIMPNVTYLDHFKSIEGDRRKDKTVAITKSMSIPFTFDEINADNLEDFLYGLKSSVSTTVAVMQKTNVPVEGRAILRFKTNVGNSFNYIIPKCSLRAEGGLSFNAEDWINGKFVLEVLRTTTYTLPEATATSADYGYLLTNLSASLIVDTCEADWAVGPVTNATNVQVINTATQKAVGTKSTKITVATFWSHVAASAVKGTNCLAYKTITATNITPYNFIELYLMASVAFTASAMYIGFESTATPIGAPVDYTALEAITTTKTWEKQRLAVRNRGAGLTAVTCVGIYGTSAQDVTTAASTQTVWLDQVRCVN